MNKWPKGSIQVTELYNFSWKRLFILINRNIKINTVKIEEKDHLSAETCMIQALNLTQKLEKAKGMEMKFFFYFFH